MKRSAALLVVAVGLAGCDPVVHVAWKKDFEGPLDAGCIEGALQTVAAGVTRHSLVSDGTHIWGLSRGREVTQFHYAGPGYGDYSLEFASLGNGKTRYFHSWATVGSITPEEESEVLPHLDRVNAAVAKKCGLSFAGMEPRKGRG